jgi:small subunit ribosomal protein S7
MACSGGTWNNRFATGNFCTTSSNEAMTAMAATTASTMRDHLHIAGNTRGAPAEAACRYRPTASRPAPSKRFAPLRALPPASGLSFEPRVNGAAALPAPRRAVLERRFHDIKTTSRIDSGALASNPPAAFASCPLGKEGSTESNNSEKAFEPHAKTSRFASFARYASAREFSATQKHCLQKFINLCMKDGKKNKSYKIISNTLWRLAISEGAPALPASSGSLILLMNAIENVKPIIEVKKVRISGTTQLVPSILSKNRQRSLAIRWILEAAILRRNTKKSMTLDQCLFAELMDAFHNIGTVRKRRDDLHKLAEFNRGFAHYRWW